MTDVAGSAMTLTTRSGFAFRVRQVSADDMPRLAEFFRHVTPEDLRFRFLASVREVSHARLLAMTGVDHDHAETFLALDETGHEVLATAALAADEARERAEVALAIRPDFKGRGLSWTLLEHVVASATARGIAVLESIESRENHGAISLEREMGFVEEPVEGDPASVILRRKLRD